MHVFKFAWTWQHLFTICSKFQKCFEYFIIMLQVSVGSGRIIKLSIPKGLQFRCRFCSSRVLHMNTDVALRLHKPPLRIYPRVRTRRAFISAKNFYYPPGIFIRRRTFPPSERYFLFRDTPLFSGESHFDRVPPGRGKIKYRLCRGAFSAARAESWPVFFIKDWNSETAMCSQEFH